MPTNRIDCWFDLVDHAYRFVEAHSRFSKSYSDDDDYDDLDEAYCNALNELRSATLRYAAKIDNDTTEEGTVPDSRLPDNWRHPGDKDLYPEGFGPFGEGREYREKILLARSASETEHRHPLWLLLRSASDETIDAVWKIYEGFDRTIA